MRKPHTEMADEQDFSLQPQLQTWLLSQGNGLHSLEFLALEFPSTVP